MLGANRAVPPWIDAALARAVHPDPSKRYGETSEFLHDLRHPNKALLGERPPALLERNPLVFWQLLSLVLAMIIVGMLAGRALGH